MSLAVPDPENVSMDALRRHDGEAWENAYEELWKVCWRSAKRKLPLDSAEQLEDLISQVVSHEIVPQILSPSQRAFQDVTSFRDVLNLASRIMSNRAIDEIRRRVRKPDSQDIDKTPELAVASSERETGVTEEVLLAMESLEERYRHVVEDFYFEELNTEEISTKRGRPKGSICSDLAKARQLLGDLLSEDLLQTATA